MKWAKTIYRSAGRAQQLLVLILVVCPVTAPWVCLGQGTLIFSGPMGLYGTNYYEQGFWFRVVVPTPGTGSPWHDGMGIAPAITTPANIPYNDTPYMFFFRQNSPDDYVVFSLTNGTAFGLVSVQLADPRSPSYTNLPISFVGCKAGGIILTNIFATPGNGADRLLTYGFAEPFRSGLLWVAIHADRWAMDNLRWVPEPSTYALLGLGLLALAWRRFHPRR